MVDIPKESGTDQSELYDLVKRLHDLRGSSKDWIRMSVELDKLVAQSQPHHRILCQGEWRDPVRHIPAVLVYNEKSRKPEVWTVIEEGDGFFEICTGNIDSFWSNIPYAGIAREVHNNHTKADTI